MVFDRSPALSPNEGGAGGRAQSVRSLRAKISGPSRFVRIHHDHGENAGYLAQDTKSGMVVLRYPDSERLREMCEWMGWQVTDDPVPSSSARFHSAGATSNARSPAVGFGSIASHA